MEDALESESFETGMAYITKVRDNDRSQCPKLTFVLT